VVWDLRALANDDGKLEQVVKPLDFDEPTTTHLNIDLIRTELEDFEDQELVSMLISGAQFKADVDYQIVILPHLASLPNGVLSVENELKRLGSLGWYAFYKDLPFVPYRCLPQGSTSRKHEPGRWRRTTDGGAPRYLLYDASGCEVTPLNVATHGEQGVKPIKHSTRWVKEIKPSLQDLMWDMLVLLHAALHVFFEPVYDGTDDAKDYFNQLHVAPHDRWLSGLHWTDLSPNNSHPLGTFVEEKVLGFGITCNSNIAQRASHGLLHAFCKRFDQTEEALFDAETEPRRAAWIKARRQLGPDQCKLYTVKMYTDDFKFCVCGISRTIRFLRCWSEFCHALHLIMAVPAKRVLGCSSPWLGLLTCGMFGIIAIPQSKVVQAVNGLSPLAAGEPKRFDEYRSLLGFLEHLIPFDGSGRPGMYGLYDVMRNADAYGPAAMVTPSPLVQRQAAKRIHILTHTPYITIMAVATMPATSIVRLPLSSLAYMYTDAAKQQSHNEVCYMAGYCHGLRWRIPVANKLTKLPIVALEFLAWLVSIIVFYPYLKHHVGIVLCSDSYTSVLIVQSDSAHAMLM
jgi:hypothetical protein